MKNTTKRTHGPLALVPAVLPLTGLFALFSGVVALSAAGAEGQTPAAAAPAEPTGISIYVNGSPILRQGIPFEERKGFVMVPARDVAAALGWEVRWDPAAQTLRMRQNTQNVLLRVGSTQAVKDGERVALIAAPVRKGQRVLLALPSFAQLFRAKVDYNPDTRTAFVETVPGSTVDAETP